MHRLYYPGSGITEDRIIISDKPQVHHVRDVLRLKRQDKIMVFDNKGDEYRCSIEKISDKITLRILEKNQSDHGEQEIKITVACAIPKKSQMDEIVDKLTQLGVARIIPLLTERVIVKLDRRKQALKAERWNKVALAAAKQCQRSRLPVVEPVRVIGEFLSTAMADFDLKLIPTLVPDGQKKLKDILACKRPKSILVLIGPEGDFTPGELRLARAAGCIPVTLGDAVLRVETACIAVASFIRMYYDAKG